MDDMAMEARSRAGNKFKEGLNCSESILQTFNELLKNPLNSESLKMASGFGGGLGHAGCMCGALTSSVMILGLYQGRTTPQIDREPVYNLAHEFHDRFSDQFGGTCCRVLNPHEFDTPEHLRHCLKLTGGTAKLLMEYILEKGLSLPNK
ncbi:C_GCAxxG_C_C family probable redox protein [Desulfosporosinus acidiphilus SJ4]|uniref:C_GCAxxG_C_C family probable redox protein n=1 Tax=Desulfosporosinus acidiphilus (strain DSM 22704 / JCM 16185 / SJ4) TaxID=646529 RepID=I4D6B4_DESAJ|nr:C-GCAxxG-C-C family protein [Desulfosporosinus acidiphilus]AFM41338.1 C_GCAxxG_C_C family probable redox protein [Desulfosporosinus acidiphilus SJ4]